MESENKHEKNVPSEKMNETSHSEIRRKLLRGGLVGAPVLLALKSTPVLACNCKLPSGFSTSGNLSRNGGASPCTDPAKNPAWWSSHIEKSHQFSSSHGGKNQKFSGTNISTSTPFNSIFTGSDGRPLIDVLSSGITFSSLVVAAYLNVSASRFVPGVNILDIKKMWNGTYRPRFNARVRSLLENEDYLRYTMGLPLINH